jgi:putative oxidoreductase
MNFLKLKFFGKISYVGLLIMRMGLGGMFVMHGSTKIFGGPPVWQEVGQAMNYWGVHMYPTIWGFLAAFAEFGGGILFILGFLFRPAAIMLTITMAVASTMHIVKGDPFTVYSHAVELGIVFLGLIFVGPGKLSIDGE